MDSYLCCPYVDLERVGTSSAILAVVAVWISATTSSSTELLTSLSATPNLQPPSPPPDLLNHALDIRSITLTMASPLLPQSHNRNNEAPNINWCHPPERQRPPRHTRLNQLSRIIRWPDELKTAFSAWINGVKNKKTAFV